MTIFSNKMAHNQQTPSQIILTLKILDTELKKKKAFWIVPSHMESKGCQN